MISIQKQSNNCEYILDHNEYIPNNQTAKLEVQVVQNPNDN